MELIIGIFVFLIGLFIGSFLNVVIMRWDSDTSCLSGRSVCAHTGKTLPWYDLVPVLSFVVLRGKSRFSGKVLSMQYPLVELLTGVMFAALFWMMVGSVGITTLTLASAALFALHLIIASILIVIAVYDFHTKIIPNPLVYAFIALAFIVLLIESWPLTDPEIMWRLLAAPILWAPFAGLWFFSGGRLMGYGDAKLAWGIGWMLGLLYGTSAIVLAFWIGAVVGVVLVGLGKLTTYFAKYIPAGLSVKSEIPFAPFIILAVYLVLLFELNVFLLF